MGAGRRVLPEGLGERRKEKNSSKVKNNNNNNNEWERKAPTHCLRARGVPRKAAWGQ